MDNPGVRRPVPSGTVPAGFEAVITGETSPEPLAPHGWPISRCTDARCRVVEQWSLWTWHSDPAEWDEEMRLLNAMQERLGPLADDTREIRAHIGSLVLCDPGLPVTIDDLLAAIGRGRFLEAPFHDGCWCAATWYACRATQPGQQGAMAAIEGLVRGYLAGQRVDALAERFPDAAGLARRACAWLPPRAALSEVQRLLLERLLLPFPYFAGRVADAEAVQRDCYEEGGRGEHLDREIAAQAGLPRIYADYHREFREALASIEDPRRAALYRIAGAMAHGLHNLSDCHHSAFRWIERWLHDIGTLAVGIPERPSGTERRRLAEILFGYTLGLDKWLLGRSMQFLLLDLAYLDLGCDPRDSIARVYAHLGEAHGPVQEWLAGCLWKSLSGAGNPRGLVIQEGLNERARGRGLSTRQWMDARLADSG